MVKIIRKLPKPTKEISTNDISNKIIYNNLKTQQQLNSLQEYKNRSIKLLKTLELNLVDCEKTLKEEEIDDIFNINTMKDLVKWFLTEQ